jgi:hypothetical protein
MNGLNAVEGLGSIAVSVVEATAPLVFLFVLSQFLFLKLPRAYVFNLLKGTAIAMVGLVLFLQGVRIGFLPVGTAIGETLGAFTAKWALIPIGFALGFLATFGEPAVRILTRQVERSSSGYLRKSLVLYTISLGVACLVAVGMAKIIYGIPLLQIIVPGYVIALSVIWFSPKAFVSIAFDAGGVATGPMAVTFLMAVAVGAASSMEGRDPVVDGFGLIALIALAPVLSVMFLGLIFRIKEHHKGGLNGSQ